MKSVLLYAIALCECTGIVPFPSLMQEIERSEDVEIVGFLEVKDEIVIYDSREASNLQLIYPYCVSAIADDEVIRKAMDFRDKRVRITGKRYKFEDLQRADNGEFLEAGRKLNGKPVSNWCWGEHIIYINEISEAS